MRMARMKLTCRRTRPSTASQTWSPDSKRIAFSSNRAGPANTGQIFVVNADGSGLRQLTSGPGGFAQPSWSWEGRRIVAYQNWETAA